MFTNLNLRIIQATDANDEYSFNDYLGLRIFTNTFAILIILSIAILSNYSFETILIIISLGAAKTIEAISDIIYGLFQKHERMDFIAKSMIIKGPLSLLLFSIGIQFIGELISGIIGIIIAWLLVLIFFDIKNGLVIKRIMEIYNKQNSLPKLSFVNFAFYCFKEYKGYKLT